MMKIVQNCFDEKVCHVLDMHVAFNKPGKAVLLFNHGLGDFVLFLPLFEELSNQYPNWDLYIGCNPERNFKYLHPKCVIMDGPYGKYEDIYDIIFNIIYPEPPRNEDELKSIKAMFNVIGIETITKPYLCNKVEIGLSDFFWEPYNFKFKLNNKNSKKIGVHFFGHTSVKNKDADYETAEFIWKQIKDAGYKPFEIQMLPLDILEFTETPEFIGKDTIRYQFPNLKIMCEEILQCRCFIGVDSGPIYLAGSILGFRNILGLQRKREFKKVLPEKITILDIDKSFDTEIIDFIKGII